MATGGETIYEWDKHPRMHSPLSNVNAIRLLTEREIVCPRRHDTIWSELIR